LQLNIQSNYYKFTHAMYTGSYFIMHLFIMFIFQHNFFECANVNVMLKAIVPVTCL